MGTSKLSLLYVLLARASCNMNANEVASAGKVELMKLTSRTHRCPLEAVSSSGIIRSFAIDIVRDSCCAMRTGSILAQEQVARSGKLFNVFFCAYTHRNRVRESTE